MSQVTAKVYASFFPADASVRAAVAGATAQALGPEPAVVDLEGDLLRLSWEGVYFPLEDVLRALALSLPPKVEGRLDSIDLDAWTLTRYTLPPEQGRERAFVAHTRGLNHVLAHSGF